MLLIINDIQESHRKRSTRAVLLALVFGVSIAEVSTFFRGHLPAGVCELVGVSVRSAGVVLRGRIGCWSLFGFFRVGRFRFQLQVPGQQFVDAVDGVVGDLGEDFSQIGLRVDAVELCGAD